MTFRAQALRYRDPLYDWALLEGAMRRAALYVLGAGASRPQIGGDFGARIRQRVWANGIYPAIATVRSPLAQRLLPRQLAFDLEAMRTGGISQNEWDALIPNELVELLLARELTRPHAAPARQYRFFDHCAPSVIFNYNNDPLGDAIHRRHVHLRPHGMVNPHWVHAPVVDLAIRHLAIPQDWIAALAYHRPLPEPTNMTLRPPYRLLQRYFEALEIVVIIGYSFGAQPSGALDDAESFEMLTDLLRWRPKPVLVIEPAPELLAERLIATTRGGRVSMLRCKWNVLAEFVMTGQFRRACARTWRGDRRSITPLFWAFEEELSEAGARAA